MCAMHADELAIDAALVARLLAAQFPRWADLPIERVDPSGTDNAIYRLGADMAIRMPRQRSSGHVPAEEFRWLPMLAPHLPLAIPEPIALGEPAEGYPCQWLICRWLDGENATLGRIADPSLAATPSQGSSPRCKRSIRPVVQRRMDEVGRWLPATNGPAIRSPRWRMRSTSTS